MRFIDVAIVGAGQAGLAMSRCLAVLGIGHALFERGQVAERWRTTAWDSLRMLTPNWINGLPWQPYDGADPHGFMTRHETVAFLERYATRFHAPVFERTPVMSLSADGPAFRMETPDGVWRARAVVIATGYCDRAFMPVVSSGLSRTITSIHSSHYRAPDMIPDGGVLIVGSSPSGLQIAEELQRAGRKVVLSSGAHARVPRRWRGRDIFWWLSRLGKLSERASEVADLEAEIRQPNVPLAGRPDYSDCDLPSMQALGVRIAGRIVGAEGEHVAFAGDLAESVTAADMRMTHLLAAIDRFDGRTTDIGSIAFKHLDLAANNAPRLLSLRKENIRTVVWATGFRRAFPWIKLPVLRPDGEIRQTGGVTPVPGVFTLGFRFQCKRDSHFFGGVGTDALEIAGHVARFLGASVRQAA